jgi:hypothetical protein
VLHIGEKSFDYGKWYNEKAEAPVRIEIESESDFDEDKNDVLELIKGKGLTANVNSDPKTGKVLHFIPSMKIKLLKGILWFNFLKKKI